MAARLKDQSQFREIVAREKPSLFISKQEADDSESIRMLAGSGLRRLTHQEALSHSSELMGELKGKAFSLTGKMVDSDGFYSLDGKGELGKYDEHGSPDRTVRVLSGSGKLSLIVLTDENVRHIRTRFILVSVDESPSVMPVVGVFDETLLEKGRTALQRLQRGLTERRV